MIKLLALSLFPLFSTIANAQEQHGNRKKFTISAGVRAGIPHSEDLKNLTNGVIGVDIQAELKFANFVSGVLSTGYTFFPGKNNLVYGRHNRHVIPVLTGLRFYPTAVFFIGGKIGFSDGNLYSSTPSPTWEPQVGVNLSQFQAVLSRNFILQTDYYYSHSALTILYKI